MRKVFADANVLIAGTSSSSGASSTILRLGEIGIFQLVVSRQVLDETERNLRKKLPHALPNFAVQMARLRLEVAPDPTLEEISVWERIIVASDAPILCAAVKASVSRFITLNTRHFTPAVAAQSGLTIQTPAQLMTELRDLVMKGFTTD
jgi:predicted nucleic acid-binding protein